MENKQITVTVNGQPYKCPVGTNLGTLLTEIGQGNMPCGGHGKCGKCLVTVLGTVNPPSESELHTLTAEEINKGIRLACRTAVFGDCSVITKGVSEKGQIRGDGEMPDFPLAPAFASYGAAVDIGTTTVAARLYDRDGRLLAEESDLNRQSAWGADVITRMEAAMAGNARRIAQVIRETVDRMLYNLAKKAGISADAIDGAVITGNTVMLHLLTNTDTEPLTHAPFRANRLFGETIPAGELGLTALSPETAVYLPPCAAAFVGADVITALLASDLCKSTETGLLIDIGTNGEMILRQKEKLYACSTAAGPAFEGAGISMGMGGQPGAIDRVWLTPDGSLDAHVIGDKAPAGLCGSGLVDAVACLLETETLDETGYLEDDPTVILSPVTITGQDIRAVQLAKSAIHAGMRTLLHAAGLSCGDVKTLCIAGGFGSYLDVKNAGRIGLLPEELVSRVRVIGNAALVGASMLLLSTELRPVCESMAREAEIVELASNPVFVAEYMERMLF